MSHNRPNWKHNYEYLTRIIASEREKKMARRGRSSIKSANVCATFATLHRYQAYLYLLLLLVAIKVITSGGSGVSSSGSNTICIVLESDLLWFIHKMMRILCFSSIFYYGRSSTVAGSAEKIWNSLTYSQLRQL